jgi:tetratricopeptide (TPR) repeat protein
VDASARLTTPELETVVSASEPEVVTPTVAHQTSAKKLNSQGEAAYQKKNYDEAIRLFQAAIELDVNYGQAYSNLGISFQKAGRVSEALWANRKAIGLAAGGNAATVRASSHYNNGRIYEAAGQWSDALREYQAAKQEKVNAVYDAAIQRMTAKNTH